MSKWDNGKTRPWTLGHWATGIVDSGINGQHDNRTIENGPADNGTVDARAKAEWDTGKTERS